MAIRTASFATRIASVANRSVHPATQCHMFVPRVWPSVPLRWPPASLDLPTAWFTCLLNATCSYRPYGHPYRFVGHQRRFTCNRTVYMATQCRTFVPPVWPSVPLRWPPVSLRLPTARFTYSMPPVRTARMAIRTVSLTTRLHVMQCGGCHVIVFLKSNLNVVPHAWPPIPLRWSPSRLNSLHVAFQ